MTVRTGQLLLERYVVEKLLGEGGMGKVFLGRHHRLGVPAALKVLTASSLSGLDERFEREAMIMARVRHPNVVAILDYGFLADGSPCIAMEYAEGEALDVRLARCGALPLREAIGHMVGILSGLEALHAESVLHRDLKPSNVMITKGRTEMVRLIDFGIALPTAGEEERLTRTGSIIGTPAYMSPEQLMCYPMDGRSDLYSAGLILYEMLTGALPFPGKDLGQVMRRLRDPLPRPTSPRHLPPIPSSVLRILGSALSVEAKRRPADAEAFIRGLGEMAAGNASLQSGPSPGPAGESAGFGTAKTVVADLTDPAVLAATGILPSDHPADLPGRRSVPISAGHSPARSVPPPADQETGRFLVGARLAPSRLTSSAERRWLAEVAGTEARSYAFGGRFWFALQLRPVPLADVGRAAAELKEKLMERYGSTAKVHLLTVGEDFALSPAALTGASPMPPELASLMENLG